MSQFTPFTTVLPTSATLQVIDAVAGPVERVAEALSPTDEVLVIVNGRPCYRPVAQLAPCSPPDSCVTLTDGCLSPGIPTRAIAVASYQRLSIAFTPGLDPAPALALPGATPCDAGPHWMAITVQDAEAIIAEGLRIETGPLALPEVQELPIDEAPPSVEMTESAPPPPESPLHAFAGLRELPAHGFSQEGNRFTWQFTVPPRTTTIRLSSPSVQPPGDPRRLGVAIFHLAMDSVTIPLESLALVRGFHRAESGEGLTWRWTDGDALVILPPRADEQILSVGLTDWHLLLAG